MELLETLIKKACPWHKRILFIDDDSPNFYKGIQQVITSNLGSVVILGEKKYILQRLVEHNIHQNRIEIVDIDNNHYSRDMYQQLLQYNLLNDEQELKQFLIEYKNILGLFLIRQGVADILIGAPELPIAQFAFLSAEILGKQFKNTSISSANLLITNMKQYGVNGAVLLSDCALNSNPNAQELKNIVISTASLGSLIFDKYKPKVGMLSFSTKGSASHELVDKVVDAGNLLTKEKNNFDYDYELQLDAAIEPEVGKRKAPNSKVAGQANILVFPDLQAANIGCSLVELLGNAFNVGPIILGVRQPAYQLANNYTPEQILWLSAIGIISSTL